MKNNYLKKFESFVKDHGNDLNNDRIGKQTTVNETGEWCKNIDWDYVKNNPGADDECSLWIKDLEKLILEINSNLKDKEQLEILDIKGFDKYQGPYANVRIKDDNYNIWQIDSEVLWIEDYPVDNTSGDDKNSGFQGTPYEISFMLNTTL